QGYVCPIDHEGNPARLCHLERVTDQAKPGYIGAGVCTKTYHGLRRGSVRGFHRVDRRGYSSLARHTPFYRRVYRSGADRLRQYKGVPRFCARIGYHTVRVDRAGHSVAKLHLSIINRMPADNYHAVIGHRLLAPGQDLPENFEISLLRVADYRQRGDRHSAHGVNVVDRIDGGNISVCLGVVSNGSEEIHRLDQ